MPEKNNQKLTAEQFFELIEKIQKSIYLKLNRELKTLAGKICFGDTLTVIYKANIKKIIR